jgi:short-subunit dehydrogenase
MKMAVVTGASSGIGKAITQKLLKMGYKVTGISRNISQNDFKNKNFTPMQVNLSDEKATLMACENLKKEDVFILINCAGFGRFEPHEELNTHTITTMSFLNLTAPMLLTHAMLRSLKQNGGYLININSIEALEPLNLLPFTPLQRLG